MSDNFKFQKAAIPESDDQFEIAQARCEELKRNIESVKTFMKHKKKTKKRSSVTRINTVNPDYEEDSQPGVEEYNEPEVITVTTKPKRRVRRIPTPAFESRYARAPLPEPPLPRRMDASRARPRYYNPDEANQRRMLEQVRDYDRGYGEHYARYPGHDSVHTMVKESKKKYTRHTIIENDIAEVPNQQAQMDLPMAMERGDASIPPKRHHMGPQYIKKSDLTKHKQIVEAMQTQEYLRNAEIQKKKERPVVEIFNKRNAMTKENRARPRNKDGYAMREKKPEYDVSNDVSKTSTYLNDETISSPSKTMSKAEFRRRLSGRGYELPTVASKMKQRGNRNYMMSNMSSIPFVVTKSITPSHNIGVNIQQVLNGLKVQQPISNIPLSIAHHMGLRHSPEVNSSSLVRPVPVEEGTMGHDKINLIQLGRRLLRLPSYKYVSYRKLLRMYKEGEGMVPRFLKSISRQTYCYQHEFSVAEQGDGTNLDLAMTAKESRHEMKQKLAEYSNLHREYQMLCKSVKQGDGDAEAQQRLELLERELANREQHIRQVVMTYKQLQPSTSLLRATASNLDHLDCARSRYNLNTHSEI